MEEEGRRGFRGTERQSGWFGGKAVWSGISGNPPACCLRRRKWVSAGKQTGRLLLCKFIETQFFHTKGYLKKSQSQTSLLLGSGSTVRHLFFTKVIPAKDCVGTFRCVAK